jgi:hypothetical protein
VLHPIPDISQFQIIAGRQEITKNDKWPEGQIDAIPHTFSVVWQVENPQSATGFLEIVQEKMTPIVTATEAWDILHTVQPRLFEEANLDFGGKLRPDLTIHAEITRKEVQCAVEFEIARKGRIKFIHQ